MGGPCIASRHACRHAGPISLRRALALHADVLAPAHRETLEALAAFAGDAPEAARLRHLASPEGKAEYQAWVAAPSRSVLEVMQAFASARPTLGARLGRGPQHGPGDPIPQSIG